MKYFFNALKLTPLLSKLQNEIHALVELPGIISNKSTPKISVFLLLNPITEIQRIKNIIKTIFSIFTIQHLKIVKTLRFRLC